MSRRTVARSLLAVAALVAVLLLANAAGAWFVERQAEERIEVRLGTPVDVNLSGFPVTPRLLTGSVPRADITLQEAGIPGTGVGLGRLAVTLTDVRYTGEPGGLMNLPIEAREVRFESRLSEEEVFGLAGALLGVEGAELADGGLVLYLPGGATADAGLAAEDGGLVLRPETPALEPEIPLTPGGLPAGASLEEVDVESDAVVIEGRADDLGL